MSGVWRLSEVRCKPAAGARRLTPTELPKPQEMPVHTSSFFLNESYLILENGRATKLELITPVCVRELARKVKFTARRLINTKK